MVPAVDVSSFSARASSIPSMPGMLRSMMPRSKVRPSLAAAAATSSASSPSAASTASTPQDSSCWRRMRRLVALSSTTSARWPESVRGSPPVSAGGASSAAPERQLEPERRPGTRLADQPEPAAHELHQLPADGEPETGAAETARGRGVRLRERHEEALLVLVRDADPRVDDVEVERHPFGVLVQDRDPDDDLALGSELDRVGAEVHEHLTDPGGVAEEARGYVGRDVDDELDPLAVRGSRQNAAHVLDHAADVEVGLLDVEPARLHLREVQDVVDDHQQALGRHLHS